MKGFWPDFREVYECSEFLKNVYYVHFPREISQYDQILKRSP